MIIKKRNSTHTKKVIFVSIICMLVCAFIECTSSNNNTVTGPSTEQGNPLIAGLVLDPSANTVTQSTVNLYRSISDTVRDSLSKMTDIKIGHVKSNSDGMFEFFNIEAGTYTLECIDNTNNLKGLKKNVVVSLQTKNIQTVDTVIIQKPGSISGTVSRGGVLGSISNNRKHDAFIQVLVKETGASETTITNGEYQISNLAPGIYTLIFYADDGFFTQYKDSVKVESQKTTNVSKVILKRIPWAIPAKPTELKSIYNETEKYVHLTWKDAKAPDIQGYEIVRYNEQMLVDTLFTTKKTFFIDDVSALKTGSLVAYVVRSINETFTRSYNEGPVYVEIK